MSDLRRSSTAGVSTKPIRCASPALRKLFEEIDRRGYNQAKVAKKLGFDPSSYSHYKLGHQTPNMMFAEGLAELLGYRLALERIDPPPPSAIIE